jgi:signal transduction histidine kinase
MLLIPLAIGIAILRYRLWDIDILINRTLVFGTLTACVVGIYVLVIGSLSLLFQTSGNLPISLVATGLVAVLFQPLRGRLQRGINRLLYGERDEPYAVLASLGQRLESALDPEAILPTIVETVRDALKLPYAAIIVDQERSASFVAASGSPVANPLSLPLLYQGEALGQLVLGPRGAGEMFNTADRNLIAVLARQAGVAAHAVRLTAALQRSREQLVLAREEERRRLRNDLHDGIGPQLAGLTMKIQTARLRLAHDPLADTLLSELVARTQDTVADIRRVVYDLRPPSLDELGLLSALRESAAQYQAHGYVGVQIHVDAPKQLEPLPAAVEVAIFRIAQEAMTHVVRHAKAQTCWLRLSIDAPARVLCLDVQDDGEGIAPERHLGVGLRSMRERAAELGGTLTVEPAAVGGTLVRARLPLPA